MDYYGMDNIASNNSHVTATTQKASKIPISTARTHIITTSNITTATNSNRSNRIDSGAGNRIATAVSKARNDYHYDWQAPDFGLAQ